MTEPALTSSNDRRPWLMAAGLAVIVLGIGLVTVRQQWRRSAQPPLPVLYGVSDFQLTNHLGQAVTLADLRGKVSVVNVIFTRCPGPCLTMSRQFARLQQEIPGDRSVTRLLLGIACGMVIITSASLWARRQRTEGKSKDVVRIVAGVGWVLSVICLLSLPATFRSQSVRLLTLTIDPEFDTREVLARYGEKLGNDPKRWWFLTGALPELRRVAIDDFKFVAGEKDAASQESKDDLFIHSTYFMILDQRARVRAVIESAEPGAVEKTLEVVNRLRSES